MYVGVDVYVSVNVNVSVCVIFDNRKIFSHLLIVVPLHHVIPNARRHTIRIRSLRSKMSFWNSVNIAWSLGSFLRPWPIARLFEVDFR